MAKGAKKSGSKKQRGQGVVPPCPLTRTPADQKPLGKYGYVARPRAGVDK